MEGKFETDCIRTKLVDYGKDADVEPTITITDLNSEVRINFPTYDAFERFKEQINNEDNSS